ncbi:hypothetical protein FNV43_RR27207 [Rhamnella rubrinervis]|uniref:DEP domain-containing protein n=1 Tax=Rhamnella rubrinervis TaxID=2594499 RepID=A0A8K0DJY7_9ROSA|nr:hypothetical protein FNV43_RR27207 [Rhamnella rubrinervis]
MDSPSGEQGKKMVENGEKVIGKFDEEEERVVTEKSDGEDIDSNLDSCDCGGSLLYSSEMEDSGQGQKFSSEKSENIAVTNPGHLQVVIQPHSQLPKPEAPPGLLSSAQKLDSVVVSDHHQTETTMPDNFTVDMPAIGKFIRERSNSLSAAIAKRLSSLKENIDDDRKSSSVNEFSLSGLRVVVKLKSKEEVEEEQKTDKEAMKERKELVERTGSSSVPQIFFNEKLFGGLVALNSLRNSGGFDQRLKEMVGPKCPDDAPTPPVYGFDDDEVEEPTDEMIAIVRVLRQRLPIQDRLMKMKIVKNCFAGGEMVDAIVLQMNCNRDKAAEVGKQLARKHFIHHVFGEKGFEDGNHFYRFLEHEPFIPKCFNFRGSINDSEPKPAAKVGERLTKIMSAILEAYASDDRRHVDYIGISNSEEFRRYINLVQELHRVNLVELSQDEKLAFFLNLYNAMVIHAVIRVGHPEGVIDRRSFFSDFQYLVGGYPYSLNTIQNGILRNNSRPPYSFTKPFGSGDPRLQLVLGKVNPLIHFGLCNGTRSSPTVRFFTPQGVEAELRSAAREYFQSCGMEVDLEKRTVYLAKIIKWFDVDFGKEKEILKWIIKYLDATKAGLLTHLLGDGSPVNVVYKNYDWSMNS